MEKLLTPQQIADVLGVKLSTVYQWTHQQYIPHVKLGRLVRFKEADIDKWLTQRSQAGRKTRKVDVGELLS